LQRAVHELERAASHASDAGFELPIKRIVKSIWVVRRLAVARRHKLMKRRRGAT
jgi:hypothetical protein